MFGLFKKKDSPLVDAEYAKVDLFKEKDNFCLNYLIKTAREVTTEKNLLKDEEKRNLVCSYAISYLMNGCKGLDLGKYETHNATRGLNYSDAVVNAVLKLSKADYERFIKEVVFNKAEYQEE
jgi:hypothetical protein